MALDRLGFPVVAANGFGRFNLDERVSIVVDAFVDTVVARYDANGALSAGAQLVTIGSSTSEGLTVADDGTIFTAGRLIDGSMSVQDLVVEAEGMVTWVTALEEDGTVRWIGTYPATSGLSHRLAMDPAGDLVLIQTYGGELDFGTHVLNGSGVAVATLDSATGTVISAYDLMPVDLRGTIHNVELAIDPADGGRIIAGTYDGELDLPGLTPSEAKDGFVARMEQDGSVAWAHTIGGAADDEIADIVAHPDHGLAIAGVEGGGPLTVGAQQVELSYWGGPLAGVLDWSGEMVNVGAPSGERSSGVDFTPEGGLVTAGYQLIDDATDVTISWLDTSLAEVRFERFGEAGKYDHGRDVTVDCAGNVYLMATHEGPIDFGFGTHYEVGNWNVDLALVGFAPS